MKRAWILSDGFCQAGDHGDGGVGRLKTAICIDSGGTKTICLVARADGTLLGAGVGGPGNELHLRPGEASEALAEALRQALAPLGGHAAADAVYASAPGLPRGALEAALAGRVDCDAVSCEGDDLAAFRGALASDRGVVVAAGTGSFAVACDGRGRLATAGGWGPLLGDEGSAHDIGLSALRAVVRAEDGREAPTALSGLVREALGYVQARDLRDIVYRQGLSRRRIGGLAVLVSAAASRGDAVASRILDDAGRSLASLGLAAAGQLEMTGEEFTYTATGGVVRAGELVLRAFRDAMGAGAPRATYVPCRYEPVIGAVILAFERAGVLLNERALERLGSEWARWRGNNC
ncbi:MAG: BadF/BadG/BcrA/BcrD ATPase family protein [Bacillota bacterium]|nr:BadF/BadG/BcrA/BcrD ATPase family protein [Bacillota bacterium]